MSTAQLLNNLEQCARKGLYSRDWELPRLPAKEMLQRSLRASLTASEGIWGDVAGSAMLQLASDRGLDSDITDLFGQVMHHSALADILVTAIRKPNDEPWKIPEVSKFWTPDCYLSPDGSTLRRIVLVSYWSDARHYAECRSWGTLGEIAHLGLPMQLIVCVIGQQRNGRRRTPWAQCLAHPVNKTIRFRKRQRTSYEGFNEKWTPINREDRPDISRETWLQGMLTDDVLPEVLFRVDIPVPEKPHLQKVRDMAQRKLDRLANLKRTPEPNLSSCDRPKCPYLKCCWVLPEREPGASTGYLRVLRESTPSLEGSLVLPT